MAARELWRQEGPGHLRRAVWVLVAGYGSFCAFLYGLGNPVAALYAVFGALPLIMFCRIPGPARERTRTLLAALPVSWALVTAGTLLAVRSWTAACGMVVVGFAVSYCEAGGPRPAGLGMAFQLHYVLPCFPPYAPDTLGDRLGGLTVGYLLAVLAQRVLWPEPPPVPYRVILADAEAAAARYAESAARRLDHGTADGDDDAELREHRAAAHRTGDATRLSRVPPTERPTSPSVRDLALNHARAGLRQVRNQLDRLAGSDAAGEPDPAAAALLRHAAAALHAAARALREGMPGERADALRSALAGYDAVRTEQAARASPARLRQDAVARAAAEGGWLVAEAARIALGGRPLAAGATEEEQQRTARRFPYAVLSARRRWWHRLRLHLTFRSVHLQNALRVAFALAAARIVAGELALAHGFWVLLATLSLMRTSAADTRSALVPAFAGTVVGAALAAVVVRSVGDVPAFYAAVLPVVILAGFGVAPLLGPAWTQGAFTMVFLLVFAQITPPDWRLSAMRLLDVVVGGSIGALAGLLAWPKGGRGELQRDIGDFLVRGAEGCRTVARMLCDGRDTPPDPLAPARRAMLLAEASYVQYRTERISRRTADPSWETAMAAGYHVVRGGEFLLSGRKGRPCGPLPREAAAELTDLAGRVATECLHAARAVAADGTHPAAGPAEPDPYPAAASAPLRHAVERAARTAPSQVLLVADVEAWLTGVARDARRAL
ncbi:FUSC family protein [Streptomyces sp. NPDC002536]